MEHISKVLEENGYNVKKSDIINMTFNKDIEIIDFLNQKEIFDGDIITNPPFSLANQFVQKALDSVKEGAKVAMFLKLQFLEGKKRYWLFKENPPRRIYVAVNRFGCTKDGVFNPVTENAGSAICYCWFIWEKGFKGDPTIKWINY